ncbi:MAG: XisI protein [bacterium]|nr:XisI protein [bacterium]
MQVDWNRGRRVRGNLIYVTLKDGKVYIEHDGIEQRITDELIQQGISPEHIVLAFQSEKVA